MGASLGPICLACPSFSQLDVVSISVRVQESAAFGDAAGQETCLTCCEWLWLQRLKRCVESDLGLMCSRVIRTGKPSLVASSERGIVHLAQVSPFGEKIGDGSLLACH
jgi:hypothetical protein